MRGWTRVLTTFTCLIVVSLVLTIAIPLSGRALHQDGGIPSGAVMAFNLDSCPASWSPADGKNGAPNLAGRFPIGVGPLPHDPSVLVSRGAFGGSHQVRLQGFDNQFQCCADDQGIGGVGIEWSHEGMSRYQATTDDNKWYTGATAGTGAATHSGELRMNTDGQQWLNHLPPFWGLLYCIKS